MTLRTDAKYPNRRAYVLKLRSEALPGALSGRLENLVTGRQGEFASAHQLLELLEGDIASPERADDR